MKAEPDEVGARVTYAVAVLRWLRRSWPVWIPVSTVALHRYLVFHLPGESASIHAWFALCLQLAGGALVLYAIDANLGLFLKGGLRGQLVNYLRSLARIGGRAVMVEKVGDGIKISGQAAVFAHERYRPPTLEQRIANLEEEAHRLSKELKQQAADFDKRLCDTKDALKAESRDLQKRLDAVKRQLESITVSGVKPQILGVLFLIHGAVASFLGSS